MSSTSHFCIFFVPGQIVVTACPNQIYHGSDFNYTIQNEHNTRAGITDQRGKHTEQEDRKSVV